jgi:hypothetical protein
MRRLPAVIAASIVVILFSLFHVLMALGMFLTGTQMARTPPMPSTPAFVPWVIFGLGVLLLAAAGWGIATAVGLLRMRRWARYSILVLGGIQACFSLISMLTMLLVAIFSSSFLPAASQGASQPDAAIVRIIFGVMALFYAIPFGVGVWWLVYFNLRRVRQAFASGVSVVASSVPSRRPLLISILAVLCLIGAPSCLLMICIPFPLMIFGLLFSNPWKIVYCVAFALLEVAVGYGLWKLLEWARRLALVLQLLGIANTLVYVLRPSLLVDYTNRVNVAMGIPHSYTAPQLPPIFYSFTLMFSILVLAAIAFGLHYYRFAFQPAIELLPYEPASPVQQPPEPPPAPPQAPAE